MAGWVRDSERLQRRRGNALVGSEAAARGVSQGRVTGGVQVQLQLGDLLGTLGALGGEPLHLGGDLLRPGAAGAQVGGDRLEAGNLLFDIEAKALAQQLRLAGEVVGE